MLFNSNDPPFATWGSGLREEIRAGKKEREEGEEVINVKWEAMMVEQKREGEQRMEERLREGGRDKTMVKEAEGKKGGSGGEEEIGKLNREVERL